jgi:SAM-dependent methyltransferase
MTEPSPGKGGRAPGPPLPWITRFAPLIATRGPVLDLAAGGGRHTRFFLTLGHPVTAVDVDVSGLEDLRGRPEVEIVQADLEDGSPWPLAGRWFAAVVVTNYLWRPLFPHILAAIDTGGLLLYETFARGNEAHGRPDNPDFLLQPGELFDLVRGRLQVVAYEHGYQSQPRPMVKSRICAIRGDDPVAVAPDTNWDRT